MPELVHDDDHQTIVAGDLRLAFRWSGDRWTHDLEHRGPRDPRPIAWSFETTAEHADPSRVVSPAFQQLSFQEAGPDRIRALLVGQSGRHHFSAVFEVHERRFERHEDCPYPEDPYAIDITIEVADRCRDPVESLASTYRVAASSSDLSDDLLVSGPKEMAWDLGPNRLVFVAGDPAQVAFAEDGRRATRVQAIAAISPGLATHRWTYYWQWETDLRWITDS